MLQITQTPTFYSLALHHSHSLTHTNPLHFLCKQLKATESIKLEGSGFQRNSGNNTKPSELYQLAARQCSPSEKRGQQRSARQAKTTDTHPIRQRANTQQTSSALKIYHLRDMVADR